MKLNAAQNMAAHVDRVLGPYCSRFFVAGSVRRQVAEVKDVEFVVTPRYQILVRDLFKPELNEARRHDGFGAALNSLGLILKGTPDGRYLQILADGVKLDVFIPQDHDFFRILAIRTGSADYSHRVIAKAWTDAGWCGTADGLRLMTECKRVGKAGTWKCVEKSPTLPPVWRSEEEFFAWLLIPYPDPKDRIWVNPAPIPYDIKAAIDGGEFTPVPE